MAKAVPLLNTSTGAESESLQVVALSRTRSRVHRGPAYNLNTLPAAVAQSSYDSSGQAHYKQCG